MHSGLHPGRRPAGPDLASATQVKNGRGSPEGFRTRAALGGERVQERCRRRTVQGRLAEFFPAAGRRRSTTGRNAEPPHSRRQERRSKKSVVRPGAKK